MNKVWQYKHYMFVAAAGTACRHCMRRIAKATEHLSLQMPSKSRARGSNVQKMIGLCGALLTESGTEYS